MIHYQGKWALITGASAGIGETFAHELAKKKVNLILVARREDRLKVLSDQLRRQYQIEVDVIALDLSKTESPHQLFSTIERLQRPVRILINNAGFGVYGTLHQTDVKKNEEQILLNVFALAALTQLFLPAMVKDRDGMIINVASVAGFQPVPYMSVYGASKAFVLSFTEALWAEYRNSGIRVLALCPGPVETEFFKVLGESSITGERDTPEEIVKTALRAAEQDKMYVIPGHRKNYILAQLSRLSPRWVTAKIAEKMMRLKTK